MKFLHARVIAVVLAFAGVAHAEYIETVSTTKGDVFRGELVESVHDDHITLRLTTGETRRIAWKDVESLAPKHPPLEARETPPVFESVRTKDQSEYRGELVERVTGDHTTLKLVTGEIKRIAASDIDPSPPPPPPVVLREPAPTETIHTKAGNVFHGVIVEKIVGEHETLALATGEVKTIDWIDIAPQLPLVHPVRKVELKFSANTPKAILESLDTDIRDYRDVCTSPCIEHVLPSGRYRVSGLGAETKSFKLGRDATNDISATKYSGPQKLIGIVSMIASIPLSAVAMGVSIADASQSGYYNNKTALDLCTVVLDLTAPLLLIGGVILMVTAGPSVRLNGDRVAQRVGVFRF